MRKFEILGALRVLADGEELALGGPRQRAVLALLLVDASNTVTVERVIDELWGARPPPTASHAVQVYVSALRKALRKGGEEGPLRRSPRGYSLDVESEHVDALRFEALVEEAYCTAAHAPSRARSLFEEALALWRGPPLADLTEFEFARRVADRLCDLHDRAEEGLMEARLGSGEHDAVISTLTRLVAAEPLRERPRQLLMLALYRAGRPAEALAAYRDACRALDEVGLQPRPELRALEASILRHDESLQAPAHGADSPREVVASPAGRPSGRDAPVSAGSASRRKVVTVLCCDVAASTPDGNELDPEALVEAVDRWSADVRAIVERHGATVAQAIGDSVLATFGVPEAHEDDALRAVRAGAEIRARLGGLAAEANLALDFRAAVKTGVVLVGDDHGLARGNTINMAARLEQAAEPREILLDHETFVLARDAVEVEPVGALSLTGGSEPMLAFRLMRVDPLAPAIKRHLDLPLVGRQGELTLLHQAFARVVQQQACHRFTLLGAAGVGKTRLVGELLASLGDAATVLSGRCLPYGEGITFWPLIEALTALGDPGREVIRRITVGRASAPQELFWEIRQVLEAAACERPVILHIDDLQWGEPMLLDLLGYLVESSGGEPILLLATARPEALESSPATGGGKSNATTFLMEALSASDCDRLLENLAPDVGPEIRTRMIAASEGNPLFLEEMVVLARDRGTVSAPPTIQALLASRLERLGSRERNLLECAAVQGEVFFVEAVGELGGSRSDAEVGAVVADLVRKDLIRPHVSRQPLVTPQALRFRHLLIRDAAYECTAKDTRARLHEQFADWLDGQALADELREIVGWHLEQAVRYRRELGRGADPAIDRRAAEQLHLAGSRAAQRSDTIAARKLLERAHALVPADDSFAARVAVDLAEQLIEGGDLARVDWLLTVGECDPETAAHAGLVRLHWLTLVRLDEAIETIESVLPETLSRLEAASDESGLAKAHLLGFWAESQSARTAAAAEHAALAATHAARAHDEGLRERALALYIVSIVHGYHDGEALTEELDVIDAEGPGPYLAALIEAGRGEVCRLAGDLDRARSVLQHAIVQFRAMQIHTMAAGSQDFYAWGELWGGKPELAVPGLLAIDEDLAAVGERGFRSTVQATLALVHERLGDLDRANAAVELAESLTASHDHLNVVLVSIARARLALQKDDGDASERAARTAVERASQTEMPFLQGIAHLELARILMATDHELEASSAATAALRLFELRGDHPRIGTARDLLAQLDGVEERSDAGASDDQQSGQIAAENGSQKLL